mgnify:CR=1 FL=1
MDPIFAGLLAAFYIKLKLQGPEHAAIPTIIDTIAVSAYYLSNQANAEILANNIRILKRT